MREVRLRSAASDARVQLLAADPLIAPALIAEIQPHMGRIHADLEEVAADSNAPRQSRINAALALSAGGEGGVAQLCELLLDWEEPPDAEQAAAIQGGLASARDRISPATAFSCA